MHGDADFSEMIKHLAAREIAWESDRDGPRLSMTAMSALEDAQRANGPRQASPLAPAPGWVLVSAPPRVSGEELLVQCATREQVCRVLLVIETLERKHDRQFGVLIGSVDLKPRPRLRFHGPSQSDYLAVRVQFVDPHWVRWDRAYLHAAIEPLTRGRRPVVVRDHRALPAWVTAPISPRDGAALARARNRGRIHDGWRWTDPGEHRTAVLTAHADTAYEWVEGYRLTLRGSDLALTLSLFEEAIPPHDVVSSDEFVAAIHRARRSGAPDDARAIESAIVALGPVRASIADVNAAAIPGLIAGIWRAHSRAIPSSVVLSAPMSPDLVCAIARQLGAPDSVRALGVRTPPRLLSPTTVDPSHSVDHLTGHRGKSARLGSAHVGELSRRQRHPEEDSELTLQPPR